MKKKNVKKGLLPYLFLALAMLGIFYTFNVMNKVVNDLTYDEFIDVMNKGEIEELELVARANAYTYEVTGVLKDYKDNESFFVRLPLSDEVMKKIVVASDEQGFKFTTVPDPDSSTVLLFVVNVLPIVLLIAGAFWFLTRQMAGNKSSLDFGKSRARLNSDKNKVTFKDVAGLKEEKEEVKELIDFLKNPKKFQKLGARIPKGVLLFGPPGTGKTLLAKAVAGEANVPFYFISGSDFVELFVGVGASRVRDMFQQAKRNAPCLIFIDEIDAVGRQRGTGLGGGHDEREQTLNQLLTEMDGFGANEGIIIIAATNRPDVLDPALLRAGRFDRQITIPLPDRKGREAILKVHARNKKLASDVNLENLARRTPGFSGAELENVLNEAAILAVRSNKTEIDMEDLDEAIDRVMSGPAKKSRIITEKEKKLVAYHESGHALIGMKIKDANVVQKVTIIPRGDAGGYVLMTPEDDQTLQTKSQLLAQITSYLAGRVSEEIFFKDVTTGAQSDIQAATRIARIMVTELGMSKLGPVQYETNNGSVFLGRDYANTSKNFSGQVAYEIDKEVRDIIDMCYEKARKTIEENKDTLILIAEALLEKETLTREEIKAIVEEGKMPKINKTRKVKKEENKDTNEEK